MCFLLGSRRRDLLRLPALCISCVLSLLRSSAPLARQGGCERVACSPPQCLRLCVAAASCPASAIWHALWPLQHCSAADASWPPRSRRQFCAALFRWRLVFSVLLYKNVNPAGLLFHSIASIRLLPKCLSVHFSSYCQGNDSVLCIPLLSKFSSIHEPTVKNFIY